MPEPTSSEPRYFKSGIPEGRSGSWRIETFEVEPVPAEADPDIPDWMLSPPGRYTRLKDNHVVFMTDLYYEWFTQKIAMQQALRRGGHVLISGLGLGMVVESILRAPDSPVEKITVLELSADVMTLCGSYLERQFSDRLEILQADVYAWQPPAGQHYSVVWHDIWPNPQAPEVEGERIRLEERYGHRCNWHGSWPQEYLWLSENEPWNRDG